MTETLTSFPSQFQVRFNASRIVAFFLNPRTNKWVRTAVDLAELAVAEGRMIEVTK